MTEWACLVSLSWRAAVLVELSISLSGAQAQGVEFFFCLVVMCVWRMLT
jgi:hypothetical protein